jgi:two-component system, NarL family, nitrate/nitrite response regulator NarL
MGSAGGMDATSGEAGRTRSRPLSSATVADRIKVVVVDAHPLYRHGLANAVAGSRVVVVAEGGTAEDARRAVQKGKPDILLMDTAVPGDGMGAAQAILRLRSGLKVVVLTASDSEEDVAEALRIGVHGYILKDVSGSELVSAIEAIHRGEPYVTPALASRLLMRSKGRPLAPHKGEDVGLTARDKRILGYLAKGLTNQEIARSLGMNVRTVKHYLTQVFRKMRVRNRVEATVEAQRMRLELDGQAPP